MQEADTSPLHVCPRGPAKAGAWRIPASYAGIGSRATPPGMLVTLEAIAKRLAIDGWTVRTGLSPGADQAFYRGALAGGGRVELYLPHRGFQGRARASAEAEGSLLAVLQEPSEEACALADRFHPDWAALADCERRLRARDAHIILGRDLASPVAFVCCWTPDASTDGSKASAGGTGQALRIARAHGVPVVNSLAFRR